MLAALFLLAVAARLIPALFLPNGAIYDFISYKAVGDEVLRGGDVYSDPQLLNRYPYMPFAMYFFGIAEAVSLKGILPFTLAIKAPLALVDGAITLLIFASAARLYNRRMAVAAALLYALNPVSILVTGYHGQFDSVSLFFLLMVLYMVQFRPSEQRANVLLAGLFLGLAILAKTWPVFLLPSLMLRVGDTRGKLFLCLSSLAAPVASIMVYVGLHPGTASEIFSRVISYGGVKGFWGYASILVPLGRLNILEPRVALAATDFLIRYGSIVMLVGLGATTLLLFRARADPLSGILTTLLVTLALTPGFGIQYLVWPVPFAILAGNRTPFRWYTLLATIYVLGYLLFVHILPMESGLEGYNEALQLLGIALWLLVLGWSLYRLKNVWLATRTAGTDRLSQTS